MAIRKPLVIVNGEIQRLQPGDTIDVQPDQVTLTFTTTALFGEAVFVDGNDSVDLAQADAGGTSDVLGLAAAGVTAASSGAVILDGVLVGTTGQWDAITGDAGGLTAGAKYYLDPSTPGFITTTPPVAQGEYVVELGQALSTTDFEVQVRRRILL